MRTLKTILGIALFVGLAYSCEPEELPSDLSTADQVTAGDTGDHDDEITSRKED